MLIFNIIILTVSILLFCIGIYFFSHTHKINKQVDKENQELQDKNNVLKDNNSALLQMYESYKFQAEKEKENLQNLREASSNAVDSQKELSQKAFENYCAVLEKQYENAEDEYAQYKDAMETAYSNRQLELMRELDEAKKDLDKIQATRAAAIQAQLKEKEIKDNKDNFRLNISEASKKDIRLLKSIQPDITNSIVIDKIIWSNYYQPLAKTKFPKIIGKATTCGIYKITSLTTGAPYIGQSSDCCDRWKQHCKNALGVGNVVNENKLYKAMKEEGLYNFTFEILEECDRSVLDEKEKYYIKLYKAYDFGLNGNRGNN